MAKRSTQLTAGSEALDVKPGEIILPEGEQDGPTDLGVDLPEGAVGARPAPPVPNVQPVSREDAAIRRAGGQFSCRQLVLQDRFRPEVRRTILVPLNTQPNQYPLRFKDATPLEKVLVEKELLFDSERERDAALASYGYGGKDPLKLNDDPRARVAVPD